MLQFPILVQLGQPALSVGAFPTEIPEELMPPYCKTLCQVKYWNLLIHAFNSI